MIHTKRWLLEDVVKNGYAKVSCKVNGKSKKVLIDSFTASTILAVLKRLNEANQEKLLSMDWVRMQNTAFKLAQR